MGCIIERITPDPKENRVDSENLLSLLDVLAYYMQHVVTNSFAVIYFKLALLPCHTCCRLTDLQSKIAPTLLQTKIAIWDVIRNEVVKTLPR
ncbi:hypothetical protein AVEN_261334-1 [Araneus ventricosus]|uniref:Uncharacterized protein n=1 Tax=Araneus ventricosus TaxID=182803 RepID=A0A4Y2JP64_ARAVE|nr:hypothetical protein AVEN_261334-1 [Araneus ventricosus]